jgi:NADH-quinone oxidoreductase subunit G/NADP-reducing hydrogenase subunit HndD
MINLTIDDRKVSVPDGSTILEAARSLNMEIPSLCWHPDQTVKANCRVCVVEVVGQRVLQPACAYPVSEGMQVRTTSSIVREARRNILELILAHHPQDCLSCQRNGTCELQALASEMNMAKKPRYPLEVREGGKDLSSPSIVREPSKCIMCGRCIAACSEIQTVHALAKEGRGFNTVVKPEFDKPIGESVCINCGHCIISCPTGALLTKDDTQKVWDVLSEKDRWEKMLCTYDDAFVSTRQEEKKYDKWAVCQTAPAVRITLGESFGLPPGTITTGKMVSALRMLGFDAVFDTDFTADLTIIEEGNELLHRLKNGGVLPMITSCSPGWVKFAETFYSDLIPNLSSCKSPQQMFGALLKTYYADKIGKAAKDILSVSIMPCTAKKYECTRPEMNASGAQDVDVVLTVRELARLIKEVGINFKDLPESEFDAPFGIGSGAGEIFGATGGVCEAALRTVYEVVTGRELQNLEFVGVRGLGIKEASIDLDGTVVRVAVASGLGNARKLMEEIRAGNSPYHFIEIMACPGGCIGGGGNPINFDNLDGVKRRMQAVYEEDVNMKIRQSHKNPAVTKLYDEFLKEPLGEKSHHLLHTHYTKRDHLL